LYFVKVLLILFIFTVPAFCCKDGFKRAERRSGAVDADVDIDEEEGSDGGGGGGGGGGGEGDGDGLFSFFEVRGGFACLFGSLCSVVSFHNTLRISSRNWSVSSSVILPI
jgi:hypothetical protein